MMQSVACCTIDDWRVRNIFSVMDHHRPYVNEDEENDVSKLLQWEDEGEHVVWY